MDDESDLWDDKFSYQERKSIRKERKRKQLKDSSRFKQSDLQKHANIPNYNKETHEKGVVQAIYSLTQNVIIDGKEVECTLKGALKKQTVQYKRPIAVGDKVFVEMKEDKGVIVGIEERTNILSRSDSLKGQTKHIIAANIDALFITMSVISPALKPSLIDRYLIAAIKGNLVPVIVINKIDLLEQKQHQKQKEFFNMVIKSYKEAGFTILPISADRNKGMLRLKKIMRKKTTVFSGQSGVGKSSIINVLCKQNLRTGSIIHRTNKGKHTTTRALLLPTNFGGFVVDTPGVKSFGVWGLEKKDLQLAFPEFEKYRYKCKYDNCYHVEEKQCGVKEALEAGKIKQFRYDSYEMLYMESCEKTKRYR